MLFSMNFGGFFGMILSLDMVAQSSLRIMASRFVIAFLVPFRSFPMMLRGPLMMFGCFFVMFCAFVCHGLSTSFDVFVNNPSAITESQLLTLEIANTRMLLDDHVFVEFQ
jgi:hypothetical protein